MNTDTLKEIFQSPFNYPKYSRIIVHGLFGCNDVYETIDRAEQLDPTPDGDQNYFLGQMEDAERQLLGFFYTRVAEGSDVRRKRVGLRKLIQPYLRYEVEAAIAVFDDGQHWRLSYICDHKEGTTSAKRFSYVLGDKAGQYKTPLERLNKIASKYGRFKLEDLKDAFSVDALSKEFFDEYHRHYDRILKTTVELISKDPTLYSGLSKLFADYIKKMMGRIVFLHFLQKKGWLNGDPDFLKNLFFMQPLDRREDFLEQVLEPLFFGIFNTEPQNREKLFRDEGWNVQLLEQWKELPYLNGGLFERDSMDEAKFKLPATLFERLFEFMASYNFTVDENDPDDADIGVDPEMLGKIFESLLEDNKAKGAFYTPKEIVRYMCKESLIAYLNSKVNGESEENQITNHDSLITAIRQFVEQHELPAELEPYREVLDTALRQVKICDPAIGSGAFPMGLLNELWRCREAMEDIDRAALSSPLERGTAKPGGMLLETDEVGNKRAALKKEIIENNIYGVDIEKGAIDIARLRFWLSIVVDAERPEPLPNFDYKFMQGNSLIESFDGHDLSHILESSSGPLPGRGARRAGWTENQTGMEFGSEEVKQNLRNWLKIYFSLTDHKEKAYYRELINSSVKNYIVQQGIGPAAETRLNAIDPSANKDFFLWHTWFKDIFDSGGFDIVVANPPYVLVSSDDLLAPLYRTKYKTANEGKVNLYKLFYEFGLSILKGGGTLSYITPNTYLTNKDSSVLRNMFFTQTALQEIIEYTEKDKVFVNVTQAVTTIVLQKRKPLHNDTVSVRTYKHGHSVCNQSDLKKAGVILPINSVIKHLNTFPDRLSNWFSIYQGEINLTAKRHLFSTDKSNNRLPMWRGNNVGKYYCQSTPIEWCETSGSKPSLYNHERIVMQQVSNQNQPFRTKAFLSPQGFICGNSTNGLSPVKPNVNLQYYIGLINSKTFNYYFDYFSFTNHITAAELKSIPIPNATLEQQKQITGLVQSIQDTKQNNIEADTSTLEHEIDKLVYQLYNLTPKEIVIIEQ